MHFDAHHPLSKHANIREPLTGPLFFYAAPASHITNERRTPDAADGERQWERERGAERNAERSGGTVVWLDPPAAEPPVR